MKLREKKKCKKKIAIKRISTKFDIKMSRKKSNEFKCLGKKSNELNVQ
jgi:hypothetical protein